MDSRKVILLTGVVAAVFLFTRCFRDQSPSDPRGRLYAGSNECLRCHQSISSSYAHTAHFLSTRIARDSTINGSFSKDSNELIVDDSTRITMEKRDSGFYQVLYQHGKEISAHRFDVVMGAVKGQTYLSLQQGRLFQLPVSYVSALSQWTSSPGYSFTNMNFSRPVVQECFGCHSSFADQVAPVFSGPAVMANNKWILNIDCERCHGPAAAHVQFHNAHPEEKQARYMESFQSLSRTQKIDLCAVCHSGTKHILLRSSFAFKMGDSLSSYMITLPNADQPDVHGNQAQLLSRSKCFRMSTMDCTTCHDTHVNQRGFVSSFNDHCQGCHSPGKHVRLPANESNPVFLQNNCTGCHMPAQASKVITVQTGKNTVAIPTLIVNHRIAVYPEETVKMLKMANPN